MLRQDTTVQVTAGSDALLKVPDVHSPIHVHTLGCDVLRANFDVLVNWERSGSLV